MTHKKFADREIERQGENHSKWRWELRNKTTIAAQRTTVNEGGRERGKEIESAGGVWAKSDLGFQICYLVMD